LLLLAASAATAVFLALRNTVSVDSLTCIGAATAILVALLSPKLFSDMYERLLSKKNFSSTSTFQHLVETRSGIVAVTKDGTVYGGGMYDGRFNTDPIHDTNGIVRAYAIDAFHSHPAQVLMIGLSSGSWAQVIANDPNVSRLTIIEINSGYLRLIKQYPEVSSVLQNPKVQIVIDDGRRWLVHNTNRRFDLVVMNTSFNWRAHMSNLLSVDFLELVRRHLNPGGVLYYNTTGSGEVQRTGATVFPYALRVLNFLAVSDSPIQVDKRRWGQSLQKFKIDGQPVFDLNEPSQLDRFDKILSLADTIANDPHAAQGENMETGDSIRTRWKRKRLITDDNMGTEWQ